MKKQEAKTGGSGISVSVKTGKEKGKTQGKMSNMDNILSNEIILVGDIVSYYIEKNEEYDFSTKMD